MKDTLFLTMNRNGVVKMTKSMPSLSGGEVACRVNVQVADHFFRDTFAVADLTVDSDQIIEPVVAVEVDDPPEDVEDEVAS